VTANIARLHIALADTKPKIWRQVEVPLATSLADLHDFIQAVMPWDDCHLFRFEIGDKTYGIPDPELDFDPDMRDAGKVTLADLTADSVKKFAYAYDFGDDWRHQITIEALAVAEPKVTYPRFLKGEHRAPPDDVGGIPGFYEFVETITTGSPSKRKQLLDWYGGPFNPVELDLDEINVRLAGYARPLPAVSAGTAKRKSKG